MSEVEKESTMDSSKESNETEKNKNCKTCGEACDPYEKPALHCSGGCDRNIHVECLNRGSVPTPLVGDVFFDLNCASCNSLGEETVMRNRLPWLNAVVLTLYNLREKSSGISNRGYFHWKSDITTFVDKNWDVLFSKSVYVLCPFVTIYITCISVSGYPATYCTTREKQ